MERFSMVASSQAVFVRLCRALGHAEWITDPRFCNARRSIGHLDALDTGIAHWFGGRPFAELSALLELHEIPFSKVYDIRGIGAGSRVCRSEAGELVRMPAPHWQHMPECVADSHAWRSGPRLAAAMALDRSEKAGPRMGRWPSPAPQGLSETWPSSAVARRLPSHRHHAQSGPRAAFAAPGRDGRAVYTSAIRPPQRPSTM
jgi:hypothetical protein